MAICAVGEELIHAERWTDWHDKANRHFLAKKIHLKMITLWKQWEILKVSLWERRAKVKREQMNQYRITKWLVTEFNLVLDLIHHTVCSVGALPVAMVTTTQVIHYN